VRADRLVAILMMLQSRDRLTTADVARELEISERTARRDLDALGAAGLPVYSRQGRGGGWRLLGSGKTDLSGLSATEVRALFAMAGPQAAAAPGVRAAVRKLIRALPETMRAEATAATEAIVVDPAAWWINTRTAPSAAKPPPFLDQVQEAVVRGVQIELGYVARDQVSSVRRVHPLGLASKGALWYLIGQTDNGRRTFRVDRIEFVQLTDDQAERPPGFVLADAWSEIRSEIQDKRMPFRARVLVERDLLWIVRSMLGDSVRVGTPVDDGRIELELRAQSLRTMIAQLGGFGSDVEVLEPLDLRSGLADLGRQLVDLYG
jgi:predicted DNA-binding transcriptional regulator YafY